MPDFTLHPNPGTTCQHSFVGAHATSSVGSRALNALHARWMWMYDVAEDGGWLCGLTLTLTLTLTQVRRGRGRRLAVGALPLRLRYLHGEHT